MFLLWFFSGIVMMYVEYPNLSERERLDGLSTLNLDDIKIGEQALQELVADRGPLKSLTVSTLFDRPVYRLTFEIGLPATVFADTGRFLSEVSDTDAIVISQEFSRNHNYASQSSYERSIEMDQWTVYGGFHSHRPLHKVALNNDRGTYVYISSLTGQVMRDTHTWERAWNWLGSTIHWIYPMQLRKYPDTWVAVVIVVSSLGLVVIVSGTMAGLLRLRTKRRYKGNRVSPYTGTQKWHHLLGLFSVLFIFTFTLSGLFSMNPFGIFNNKTSFGLQLTRYEGMFFNLTDFDKNIAKAKKAIDLEFDLKELEWLNIKGKGVLVAKNSKHRQLISFEKNEIDDLIERTIPDLIPNNRIVSSYELNQYDAYYYSTHNRYRPLPIRRVIFDDEESTWFHIDATTGSLIGRLTYTDRVKRWLYNGLHSLDFQFLLASRPSWDILVLFLSGMGILFSYTSVTIAWRRLTLMRVKHKSQRKRLQVPC
jgi:hypothetical protein